ncbi:hypothetical protein GCM10023238_33950 [Streptomyces heliomycini]
MVLSVTDGCGGIPEEDLPRVFDTGWRGTHARTPPAGAGLGLAIVRGIVEAHRGSTTVRNVTGGCRIRCDRSRRRNPDPRLPRGSGRRRAGARSPRGPATTSVRCSGAGRRAAARRG